MNLSILLDLYRSKSEFSVAKEDTYGQPKNVNFDKGSTTTEMEKQEDTEMTAEYATTPENSRYIKETRNILW